VIEKNGEMKNILHRCQAIVLGPSNNQNMIKALLLDPKTKEQLNCLITLDINLISLHIPKNEPQENSEEEIAS
jgi:hypothetical protein